MDQHTLALVDDHLLFREGLRILLKAQPDLRVVAEASNAQEAYAAVGRAQPDLVVLDVVLPGVSGISVARELRRRQSPPGVLVLSMLYDEQRVAEALDAGALGYAIKEQPAGEVLQAIRAVAARKPYLAPSISRFLLAGVRHARAPASDDASLKLASLTRREREVFDLTALGLHTAQIALQLGISRRTVETHRARIFRKLDAHSAADLVRIAARLGLLPEDP